MREIKFRAWDTVKKEMVDNISTGTINIFGDKGGEHKSQDCVFMQYIGIKDKNGVDIYEGDICRGHITNTDKMFVIEYRIDPEHTGFVPVEINKKQISVFQRWNYLEVIGNIYQNKELLK